MNKMMPQKKRIFVFDMLKLIAILLILNSHFDLLYPDKLKLLATGGSWGNTIFFIVSGYFTNIDHNFFQYMKKRIIRLYPSVIIITIISLFLNLHNVVIENVADIVKEFIWPTYYWFVGALVLYYILIYLLEKVKVISSKFTAFSAVFVSVLLLYYGYFVSSKNVWCMEKMGFGTFEGWIKIISYFYVFALGYYLKKNKDIYRKISMLCSVCFVFGGAIGYMGYKLLLAKSVVPMRFQVIAPGFLYFLAFGALCLTLKFENSAEDNGNEDRAAKRIIISLSSLSLEVYLVQFSVIHFFEKYAFPINIVLATLVIFGLAYLLKNLSSYLVDRMFSKNLNQR